MQTLPIRTDHPENPPDGYERVYIGPDGHLYRKTAAGVLRRCDHDGLGMGKYQHKSSGGAYTNNWLWPNRLVATSLQTLALTHQRLYTVPWPMQTTLTVSELGIYVTGAGSGGGGVAHLLIYYGIDEDDDGPNRGLDIFPGALLLNAGTVDVTTTGEKKITGLSTVLEEGRLYFGGILVDCSTPPTISASSDNYLMPVVALDSAWSGSKTGFYNDSVSSVPDPHPVFSAALSGTTPILGLRRSA